MNNPVRRSRWKLWIRHALERRGASALGIFAIFATGILGMFQLLPNSVSVLVTLSIVLYELQKRLDQGVPLLQLAGLIAVLQWLVGPVLNYSSDISFGRYSMYVPENVYFAFAIPATTFFVCIMLVTGASIKQKNLLQSVKRNDFVIIGASLNLVAIGGSLGAQYVGGGLQFLFFLLSQTRYVGALYFLFSRSPWRVLLAAASCFSLFSMSLAIGVFHDLILWASIIFCYWFAQRHWPLQIKLFVLGLSAAILFSIQVIKQEYRERIQLNENPSIIGLVFSYVTPGGKAWETDSLKMVITRLNQGWIISAVMANVPENEPYAKGATITEAVLVSLAPRFLWADKKIAGGRDNFMKFTGLQIGRGTSMAISPLGEAYANFGVLGGTVFLCLFGAFFSGFYYGTLRYTLRHPTFLFWIPLIFYQAIKAESELSVVLNQLTKGALVAFAGHYFVGLVFPVRYLTRTVAAAKGLAPVVKST